MAHDSNLTDDSSQTDFGAGFALSKQRLEPAIKPSQTLPADSSPVVSIVIVTWNTCEMTIDCIRSILKHTHSVTFEIILVDNASNDGTVDRIRSEFPEVRLIANDHNKGFAAANNDGLAIARGKYILLLNSDTLVSTDVLAETTRYLEKNVDTAVLGCRALDRDGTQQSTMFGFLTLTRLFWNLFVPGSIMSSSRLFGKGRYAGADLNCEHEVDVVSGCFMLLRREVVENTGGFDPEFFMYGEEMEWCYRIKQQGWRIAYVPFASYTHFGGISAAKCQSQMNVEMARGQLLFLYKSRGEFVARIAAFLMFLRDVPRYCVFLLFSGIRPLLPASHQAKLALASHRIGFLSSACRTRNLSSVLYRSSRHVASPGGGPPDTHHIPVAVTKNGSADHRPANKVRNRPIYGRSSFAVRVLYLCLAMIYFVFENLIRRQNQRWVVLCYHGVSDAQATRFRRQLESIQGRVVSVQEIGNGKPGVCVTFDDAFAGLCQWVIPVAVRLQTPICIFPVTAALGIPPNWKMSADHPEAMMRTMAADELKAVAQCSVVRVGSHSHTHPYLAELCEASIRSELEQSIQILKNIVGYRVEELAVPHGSSSRTVREIAKDTDFSRVFSLDAKCVTRHVLNEDSGRFLVDPDMWPIEFWLTVRGAYGFLAYLRYAVRKISYSQKRAQ